MKKFIMILVLFLIIVGAGFFEHIYNKQLYTSMYTDLKFIEDSISPDAEVSTKENIDLIHAVCNRWEDSKKITLIFHNHTLSRALDERLVYVKKWIELNNYDETSVMLDVTMAYIRDLMDDYSPNAANIF